MLMARRWGAGAWVWAWAWAWAWAYACYFVERVSLRRVATRTCLLVQRERARDGRLACCPGRRRTGRVARGLCGGASFDEKPTEAHACRGDAAKQIHVGLGRLCLLRSGRGGEGGVGRLVAGTLAKHAPDA